MEHYRITLENREPTVALIAQIRKHTGLPLGEVRQKLAAGEPVIDEEVHHNAYDDFIARIEALVADLESSGESMEIEIDGEVESIEVMRNGFQQWRDIGDQFEAEDERREQGDEPRQVR